MTRGIRVAWQSYDTWVSIEYVSLKNESSIKVNIQYI